MALLLAPANAASATPKPTPAAIAHWQQTALKNLPPWWKGYLAGPMKLTHCRWMSTSGIRFYDCRVTSRIDTSFVAAFASLVRYSRCGYASTLVSVKGDRTLTRRFMLCP